MRQIVFTLALVCLSIFARPASANPDLIPQTIEAEDFTLKGFNLSNPNGENVILFHGLIENTRLWREIAYSLHAQGYNVWMFNFRGHGNGNQKSLVHNPKAGDYSYDHIALDDVNAIVEHVYEKTQKKMTLIGHSMGGMSTLVYTSGARWFDANKNVIVQDSRREKWIAENRIDGLVTIGSPPDFKSVKADLNFLAKFSGIASRLYSGFVYFGRKLSPQQQDQHQSKLMNGIQKFIDAVTPLFMTGIVYGPNMNKSESEMSRLFFKGFSESVHSDLLLLSFGRWVKTKSYTALKATFDFSRARPQIIPLMVVAGDKDTLARPREIFGAIDNLHKNETQIKEKLLIENTGHIDLTSGRHSQEKVAPKLIDFMKRSIHQTVKKCVELF